MAQVMTTLIDLAAGREPQPEPLTPELVSSAIEHRMDGLLHSWATQNGLVTDPPGQELSAADTLNWARNRMLAAHAVALEKRAGSHGVEICFFKGVVLETQVYTRCGERPSTDLDVIVGAGSIEDITAWIAELQPRHVWVPHLASLISARHIQAIDLVVGGVQVDLHFDPLKLEIVSSRATDELLARRVSCNLEDGEVTGLDPEASLVLALIALNKDRFRRLIGFADVARLVPRVRDWDWILRYADLEGIRTPVTSSLEVVMRRLDLPPPIEIAQTAAGRVWSSVWPERIRLRGREGAVRFRYRQMAIPMFSPRRWLEACAGLGRRLFPPPGMLRAFYPDATGPYLTVLFFGRFTRRLRRARQRAAARDEGGRSA